jgi:two-component system sporulation sensor kinase A
LTAIKGFVQLFCETQPPKKTLIYRDLIQHELSQIEHIIAEFMSLAKQEYVYTENLVITDLLDEVLKQFQSVTGVKNIHIIRHYPKEHLLLISGQKTQLTQAFIHIIQNAIDSMESGGNLVVSIEKSARETLRIVIKDSGCRIDSKRILHIGEPFYTTKERGIGLGLTICNKIINEHKGFFHVSSKKNDGTSITITLPMKTTELYVVEA